ncbi:MAG: DUF3467 domain-containing protein [Bacteroidales bacterium]
MSESNDNKNHLNIEISGDVATGIYSNLTLIAHSQGEFIMDFLQVLPGLPKAQVKSRVILTPENAKRLLYALKDNIRKFEANNGPIKEPRGENLPPFPMTGPTPEA